MADPDKKENLSADLIIDDMQAQSKGLDDGSQFPAPPIMRSGDKRRILFEKRESQGPSDYTTSAGSTDPTTSTTSTASSPSTTSTTSTPRTTE